MLVCIFKSGLDAKHLAEYSHRNGVEGADERLLNGNIMSGTVVAVKVPRPRVTVKGNRLFKNH